MALSKRAALRILETEHHAISELIGRLGPDEFTRPATIGDADWSARDLLSHLTSWDQHALDALDAWGRGQPAPVQRPLRAKGLNALNAETLAADRHRSPSSVRERYDEVHGWLVSEIRAVSAAAWRSPPTARARRPLGDVLGGILSGPDGLFAHASAHLSDLRAFVKSVGTLHLAAVKDPGPAVRRGPETPDLGG
ncbi:MAG: DinB family protein [Actinomycetota bacterium]